MSRILLSLTIFSIVALMACGTKPENDGYAISSRILKPIMVDSSAIVRSVSSMDTLIAPEIFGRDFGRVAVEMLESDTVIDAGILNRRVSMLRQILTERRGERFGRRFVEGVQSYVETLPSERRMRVYTRVADPRQMGTALRIDKVRAGADTARIAEQVAVLRSIYSVDEWEQFMEYYSKK